MSMSSVVSHHEPDTPDDLSAMSPNWMKIDGNSRISKTICKWGCQLDMTWLPWTARANILPSSPHSVARNELLHSSPLTLNSTLAGLSREKVKEEKVTFPFSSVLLFYPLHWLKNNLFSWNNSWRMVNLAKFFFYASLIFSVTSTPLACVTTSFAPETPNVKGKA